MTRARPSFPRRPLSALLDAFGVREDETVAADDVDPVALNAAAALFTLVLGRRPEPGFDLAARARQPWDRQLGALLASDEFRNHTLDALVTANEPPHLRLGDRPDPKMIAASLRVAPVAEAAGDDPTAPWRDALNHPFPDWTAFFKAVIASPGPWTAAQTIGVSAKTEERAALARATLAAPPSGGIVMRARFAGPARIEGAARVFGPTPKRLIVRARPVSEETAGEPAPNGAATAKSAATSADIAAPITFDAAAATEFVLDGPLEQGPRSALWVELAETEDGAPVGPGFRLDRAPPPEVLSERLAEIDAAHRAGARTEARDLIVALRRDAPFAFEPFGAWVETALWAGDVDRARDAIDEADEDGHIDLDATTRDKLARLRFRAALAGGDGEAAQNALTALEDASALDVALAAAAPVATLGQVRKALSASASTDRRAEANALLTLSNAPLMAEWIDSLNANALPGALQALANGAYAAAAPTVASYVQDRRRLHLDAKVARAAAAVALDDDRVAVAADWALTALETSTTHDDVAAALALASTVPHPDAWSAASLGIAAQLDAARRSDSGADPYALDALSDDELAGLERLAEAERRLVDFDPLRSRDRLENACAALKAKAGRTLSVTPNDAAARRRLATALMLGGDAWAARDILAAQAVEQPHDEAALHALLDAEERAERPAAALAAIDAAAAATAALRPVGADDGEPSESAAVALRRARALRALGRAEEAADVVADRLSRSTGDGADGGLERDALMIEAARDAFFLGDFAAAEAAAEAALRLRPHHRRTRVLAAAAALERGAPDDAERHLDAIERDAVASGMPAVGGPEREAAIHVALQDALKEAHARRLGASSSDGAAALSSPHGAYLSDPALLDARLLRTEADRLRGRDDACVEHLNVIFDALGCRRVRLRGNGDAPASFGLDALAACEEPAPPTSRIGPRPMTDGPLVSVVMTAFNAGPHLETSVRSVLDQSYRAIELIVVDDASEDDTPAQLLALEAAEPRIRAILKTKNEGTYVSKNIGMLQARGDYVAFQDSDDWSHPDRIGKTVAALETQPSLVAASLDWVRMTTDGRLVVRSSAEVAQTSRISLMMRRAPALARAGFFDSVRIEADVEHARRLALLFGPDSVARLRWPLLIGRAHPRSLTSDAAYGVTRTGLTPARRSYQSASTEWHEIERARLRRGGPDALTAGRMPFPLKVRPFDVPSTMLP